MGSARGADDEPGGKQYPGRRSILAAEASWPPKHPGRRSVDAEAWMPLCAPRIASKSSLMERREFDGRLGHIGKRRRKYARQIEVVEADDRHLR